REHELTVTRVPRQPAALGLPEERQGAVGPQLEAQCRIGLAQPDSAELALRLDRRAAAAREQRDRPQTHRRRPCRTHVGSLSPSADGGELANPARGVGLRGALARVLPAAASARAVTALPALRRLLPGDRRRQRPDSPLRRPLTARLREARAAA